MFQKPQSTIQNRGIKTRPIKASFLPLAFCLISILCSFTLAQETDAAEVKYGYQFENARFYISLIKIDVKPDGQCLLKFKRGESDELIDLKFKLYPETLTRIRQLYESTNFLSSTES